MRPDTWTSCGNGPGRRLGPRCRCARGSPPVRRRAHERQLDRRLPVGRREGSTWSASSKATRRAGVTSSSCATSGRAGVGLLLPYSTRLRPQKAFLTHCPGRRPSRLAQRARAPQDDGAGWPGAAVAHWAGGRPKQNGTARPTVPFWRTMSVPGGRIHPGAGQWGRFRPGADDTYGYQNRSPLKVRTGRPRSSSA
jgi:hypothetical protein